MRLVLALLAAQAATAPAPRGLEAQRPAIVETYQGVEVDATFAIENRGTRPFRVLEVTAQSPGGTVVSFPKEPVAPGGRAEVAVRQETGQRLGLASFRYVLKADDGLPARRLVLPTFVQSAYEPDRPELSGDPAPGTAVELAVESRLVRALTVADMSGAPGFLTVAALPQPDGTVRLRATVAKDAPLGLQTGALRLRTNVAEQPELVVPFRLAVFGDLVPDPPAVDLGVVRQGQTVEKRARVRSRAGRALDVAAVDGGGLSADTAECPEPAPSCREIRVRATGGDTSGPLAGTVSVRMRDGGTLAIPYTGVTLKADTVVRDLGRIDLQPSPAPSAAATPVPEPTPPPVPPPVTGRPGERRARLVWSAEQEDQTFGYLVYRASAREGPFVRLNARVITVGSGPSAGKYAYEDESVEPGRSYFYYLESVSKGGEKRRISGVVTKIIPAAP